MCLSFYAFNHKLICSNLDLDLDNAPMASPPLWEGAHGDTDGEYYFYLLLIAGSIFFFN